VVKILEVLFSMQQLKSIDSRVEMVCVDTNRSLYVVSYHLVSKYHPEPWHELENTDLVRPIVMHNTPSLFLGL
jgi:hypothetical protein